MEKRLIGVYNPTVILTYIGVFCAVVGLGLLFAGEADRLESAMILLIVSGVCDMFDGLVARQFKRTELEKRFGIQLDSLADTVSFVAFPAAILMTVAGINIFSAAAACFYVFAGIMRLGWFNVTTEENRGFYQGLPVTFAAGLIPLCYLFLKLAAPIMMAAVFPAIFACIGLLFILNFKMKKPGPKVLIVVAFVAVAVILGLLLV